MARVVMTAVAAQRRQAAGKQGDRAAATAAAERWRVTLLGVPWYLYRYLPTCFKDSPTTRDSAKVLPLLVTQR